MDDAARSLKVRAEDVGRDPVLAGEHLWQQPLGTLWQDSVATGAKKSSTPPGFSRW